MKAWWDVYARRDMLVIFCLGIASGLPLALTASTLGVWLTESGVSKASIGLFAIVATPYTLKFLWAPLIDGLPVPILTRLLGQRRGWLLATQLALAASILLLALASPAINPWFTAGAAVLVAICSASQDIVIDAYRVELLAPEEQGAGAASVVLGYRLGMILSHGGALYLAAQLGWLASYAIMALLLPIGSLAALWAGEPKSETQESETKRSFIEWLHEHVVAPFTDFMTRKQWLAILLFIVLYKFADAFMGIMTSPFLIDIGFTKEQIGEVVGFYGIIATIVGSFLGGAMVYRLGVIRTLWICGIAHAATNLMFMLQARMGADLHFLALSITLENVSGGMGTAAFVAFISDLCNRQFTATQYALLSSLSAFGRTWLSTPAGWFAEKLGWQSFFLLAAALALPGLMVLGWLMQKRALKPSKA